MLVKPNLLFFGAGRFSKICFESLLNESREYFRNVAVVVPPGESDLASLANELDIEVQQVPPRSLKGWRPEGGSWDFGAVASFSYFLPAALIDSFQRGIINAHPSLLPRYRGAAPIQRSMIDDFPKGISIIGLDKKEFDAGKIYLSEHTEFHDERPGDMNYQEMEEWLAAHCGSALSRVLKNWDVYSEKAIEQSGQVTFAPKITKDDACVTFKNQGAQDIYRGYLAVGHQENIRATLAPSGKLVHLLDIVKHAGESITGLPLDGKAGHVHFCDSKFWILCSDGRWIGASKFRVEGKSNTFSAKAFYKNFIMRHPTHYFE